MSTLSRLSLEENRELARQWHATNVMQMHAMYRTSDVVTGYIFAARLGEGIPDDFEVLARAWERAYGDVVSFLKRLNGRQVSLTYDLANREYETARLLGHELWYCRNGYAGFSAENWGPRLAVDLRDAADHLGAAQIYRDDANYTLDIY